MGWVTPFTYTSGAVLTAAQLNIYQRDNTLATAAGVATTAGDMFYATAPNKLGRLAAGSNRALMVYDTEDVAPEWSADAAATLIVHGSGTAASGSLSRVSSSPSSTDFTVHASAVYTPPTGWNSADIVAWGNVSVSQSDNNQTMRVRVNIGDSTGQPINAGEMSINHDITTSANHGSTGVTEATTITVGSVIVGDAIKHLVFKNAQVSFMAVRRS